MLSLRYFNCNARSRSSDSGGEKIVIVEENEVIKKNQDENSNSPNHAKQQVKSSHDLIDSRGILHDPYCVECFCPLYGGACEECDKLVTATAKARMEIEKNLWHQMSAATFKCSRCSMSLLGCPFIASLDGKFFCSTQCAETAETQSKTNQSNKQHKIHMPLNFGSHLAECEESRRKSQTLYSRPKQIPRRDTDARLLRHQPLVDYLLTSGPNQSETRNSESSNRQFYALNQPFSHRSDSHQAISNLNPFLSEEASSRFNSLCIKSNRSKSLDRRTQLTDYINLDFVFDTTEQTQTPRRPRSIETTSNPSYHQVREKANGSIFIGTSRCSPVASVASNEGANSDHSGTSSGIVSSEQPPNGSSNCGSLKSHSGSLSSGSSRSSVSSASSSISNGKESSQPMNGTSDNTTTIVTKTTATTTSASSNLKQISPGQVPSRPPTSVAASLERRRRVQPITELSVIDLLSVADEQMSIQQQLQKQEQQSQHDQNNTQAKNQNDTTSFDHLVSQFNNIPRKESTTNTNSIGVGQFGSAVSGNGIKQPESFFFELARRLPRSMRQQQPQQQQGTQVTTAMPPPLDTNGLPTVEPSVSPTNAINRPAPNITQHYSTVKKPNKPPPNKPEHSSSEFPHKLLQQVADKTGNDAMRAAFFAITSPLLDCQIDSSLSSRQVSPSSVGSDKPIEQQHREQIHWTQTSDLPTPQQAIQSDTPAVELATTNSKPPSSKPTKSVSFDPTVKDSPSGSATLTLGRASSLRSALKSSSNWRREQQNLSIRIDQQQHQHQYQHQQLAIQQLKPVPSAYSAYYDENGHRVRLSTLLMAQQSHQQTPIDSFTGLPLVCMVAPATGDQSGAMAAQSREVQSTSLGKSLWNGALAKLNLSGNSSRGGRRHERNLLQQHMHHQQPLVIQTQPASIQAYKNQQPTQLFVLPLEDHPEVQLHHQPSTSRQAIKHWEVGVDKREPDGHHPRHSRRNERYRRRRRHHSSPDRRSRRRPARVSEHHGRSGRRRGFQSDQIDYYDSDDSLSDSSICSTCSSSFEESSEYSDDESRSSCSYYTLTDIQSSDEDESDYLDSSEKSEDEYDSDCSSRSPSECSTSRPVSRPHGSSARRPNSASHSSGSRSRSRTRRRPNSARHSSGSSRSRSRPQRRRRRARRSISEGPAAQKSQGCGI